MRTPSKGGRRRYGMYSPTRAAAGAAYHLASRFLGGGSRTRTRRRIRFSIKRRPTRAGVYRSRYARKRKRLSAAKKALRNVGSQVYARSYGDRFTCNVGKCAYRVGTRGIEDATVWQICRSVDPNFSPNTRNYTVYISSITKDYMITNATTNQAVVNLYELTAKNTRVPTSNPTTGVDDNLLEKDFITSDDKLAAGDSAAASLTENDIMFSPMSKPKIYMNWKKFKCFKKIMDPGAVWHVRVYIPIHKYFNTTNMKTTGPADNELSGQVLRGITTGSIMRVTGTPASATNAEGTVTTTNARLEFVASEKIHFKHVPDMQNKTEHGPRIASAAPGGFDHVNPLDGTVDILDTA